MRCIVLLATCCVSAACKGRPNGRCRDGPLDGRRASFDGPREARSGVARVAGGARGRSVCREGRNAYTSYTNYFPHAPHRTHSAHLRAAPHICRTHSVSCSDRLVTSASTELHAARVLLPGTSLFFAHARFCVAYLCKAPYLCTRMNNTSLIDSLNAELQLAHAEMLAIRSAGIFGKVRLAACKRVIVAMEALCAAQKASK